VSDTVFPLLMFTPGWRSFDLRDPQIQEGASDAILQYGGESLLDSFRELVTNIGDSPMGRTHLYLVPPRDSSPPLFVVLTVVVITAPQDVTESDILEMLSNSLDDSTRASVTLPTWNGRTVGRSDITRENLDHPLFSRQRELRYIHTYEDSRTVAAIWALTNAPDELWVVRMLDLISSSLTWAAFDTPATASLPES
jgi:hypothetical protein